jgi:hypothetical protein
MVQLLEPRVNPTRRTTAGRLLPALATAAALLALLALSTGACRPAAETGELGAPGRIERPAFSAVAAHVRPFIAAEMEAKAIPALAVALVAGGQVVWAEGDGLIIHLRISTMETGQRSSDSFERKFHMPERLLAR